MCIGLRSVAMPAREQTRHSQVAGTSRTGTMGFSVPSVCVTCMSCISPHPSVAAQQCMATHRGRNGESHGCTPRGWNLGELSDASHLGVRCCEGTSCKSVSSCHVCTYRPLGWVVHRIHVFQRDLCLRTCILSLPFLTRSGTSFFHLAMSIESTQMTGAVYNHGSACRYNASDQNHSLQTHTR